jgi:hypothetical protein
MSGVGNEVENVPEARAHVVTEPQNRDLDQYSKLPPTVSQSSSINASSST